LGFWFKGVLNAKQSTNMTMKLRNHLNKLYDYYNVEESSLQVQDDSELLQGTSMKVEEIKNANLLLHFMNKFHKYLTSKNNVESNSKIDRYLMEDVEKRNANFDILNWWKVK
jgi:hypothetical protein